MPLKHLKPNPNFYKSGYSGYVVATPVATRVLMTGLDLSPVFALVATVATKKMPLYRGFDKNETRSFYLIPRVWGCFFSGYSGYNLKNNTYLFYLQYNSCSHQRSHFVATVATNAQRAGKILPPQPIRDKNTKMTKQHPPIKLLNDFRRYGLIGQWFGELQLIGVGYPKDSSRRNQDLICRVVCQRGHGAVRPWRHLRDRKSICTMCRQDGKSATASAPVSMTGQQLIDAITKLESIRRRLFDHLLDSRRRLPGQDRVTFRDRKLIVTNRQLLQETYNYALQIADPAAELEEWTKEWRYETRNGSSLALPSLKYVETV
jgi:hypothetical protein